MSATLLVVDDEERMRRLLQLELEEEGYLVETAGSAEAALARLDALSPDLVLTDLRMPGASGLEFLRAVRAALPETQVIVMTAYGTVETAVEAMKAGAFDYIQKPFDLDEVKVKIARALQIARLQAENKRLREQLGPLPALEAIVGESEPMRRVKDLIRRVAPTSATVLITGESGTGKELVARAIHALSPRAQGPFVAVNCGALAETLLESELFGHVRGAFTGAVRDERGKFRAADGGTIFLDEVSTMSPALQGKLLRVLQTREVSPVGSDRTIKVDVRVLAATNRPLERMVAEGAFREDLFWRLNVVNIALPPLRERASDIPMLADRFIKERCAQMGRPPCRISAAGLERLLAYEWPGNVRELENVIERSLVLSPPGELEIFGLPEAEPVARTYSEARAEAMRRFDERYFSALLSRCGGNIAAAAREAGIDRKNLYNKLREVGIDPDAFRKSG